MSPLVLAAVLATSAELVHAISASAAIGGVYWTAVARFAAVALLSVLAVVARRSFAPWLLVAAGAWLAVNYGAQAAPKGDLVLGLVALALAASALLALVSSVKSRT
jgi:hypothetical protein